VRSTADPSVPVLAAPLRPEIERDAEFAKRFLVEPDDPPGKSESGKTWEFYYLLKPKSENVTEIPEVLFSYFNPRFGTDPRGYQEPMTDSIKITVRPAPRQVPEVVGKSNEVRRFPASIERVADDDEILARHRVWTPPGAGVMAALFGGPPVVALAWLVVWRRLNPDAVTRAKLRRSRAAREAIKGLQAARDEPGKRMAEEVAGVVATYLQQRFDLPANTPTPAETDAFLRGASVPDALRTQTVGLLETCDALRFSAVPPAVSGRLSQGAEETILALEAHSWSSRSS
jgi:hypothetical protein